ncbi:hypothetical protein NKG94_14905 [Micromonospora sp. M12]
MAGQRLDADTVDLIRAHDPHRLDPHSGAALFWYVRNSLVFHLGLDRRADVLLCDYDALVTEPAAQVRRLCAFLDFPYHPRLHAHIARVSRTAPRQRATGDYRSTGGSAPAVTS